MPDKSCEKLEAAIFGQPWAIKQEWLDLLIGVTRREFANREAAADIRTDRKANAFVDDVGKVAVIPVFGPIVPRGGWYSDVSGATSIASLSARLDDAMKNPDVSSIIFNFDSPGGQATGVHEFARRIREANEYKPVTAYVSGMAASAAYWLASSCGRIVADRTAEVGSIGVIFAWTDDTEARESAGYRDYVIVSSQSPNKHLDPKTPAGRKDLQRRADALAEIFIGEVAGFRGVTAKRVSEHFGRGLVMLAESALSAGMIDEVGGFDVALECSTSRVNESGITGGCAMAVKKGTKTAGKRSTKSRAENTDDEEEDEREATAVEDDEDEQENGDASENEDENDEEPEDERENARSKSGKGSKKAKAFTGRTYDMGFAAGVAAERARIKEIRGLGIAGHQKLVDRAMFDEPMTAAELSMAYVKAESSAKSAVAKARLDEAPETSVPVALAEPGLNSTDSAEAKSLIEAMAGKLSSVI